MAWPGEDGQPSHYSFFVDDRPMGRRFLTLDAARGVAAVIVAMFHFGLGARASGQLAVDFFFMLSGFVVAYAYTRRLEGGLAWREFVRIRLARLYPTYLFSLGLMAVFFLLQAYWGRAPSDPWLVLRTFAFAILLTPRLAMGRGYAGPYPLNGPAWSIFWELIVNFIFAAVHNRLTKRVLGVIVAAGAVGMTLMCLQEGRIDGGASWRSFWDGALRAGFGFSVGVLLFRLRGHVAAKTSFQASVAVVAALAAALVFTPNNGLLQLAVVLGLFPLLLWMGVGCEPPERLAPLCAAAGRVSYPLYMIHMPLLAFANAAAARWPLLAEHKPLTRLCLLILAIAAAWAVDRYWDQPAHRWLAAKTRRQAASVA